MEGPIKRGPWVIVETEEFDYEGGTPYRVYVYRTKRAADKALAKLTSAAAGGQRNPHWGYYLMECGR
jgi:hypothetical protein